MRKQQHMARGDETGNYVELELARFAAGDPQLEGTEELRHGLFGDLFAHLADGLIDSRKSPM